MKILQNKKLKKEIAQHIDDLPMTRAISNIPIGDFGYFFDITKYNWPKYSFKFNLNGYRYRIFYDPIDQDYFGTKMILKDEYILAGL